MYGKYFLYALFVLLSTGIGFAWIGGELLGALLGGLAGALFVGVGMLLQTFGTRRLLWGMFGFIAGAWVSNLMNPLIEPLLALPEPATFSPILFAWKGGSLLFFTYCGIILALKVEQEPHLLWHDENVPPSNKILLDTSVIIDGRIADLCETGFMEGTYMIPQFVLHELQYVADSADANRRVRGRRGLDILHRLQKMEHLDLRIIDNDFPSIREVDAKLVALAKELSAKVMTNDFNLNKVAGLQGVTVLNINQLTNALRPVVMTGETMRLFVLKEGKEFGQGVAYLDDGTMIVIDDARKCIGKKVDVVVTSVLQTSAGRMIFSKLREDAERDTAYAGASQRG